MESSTYPLPPRGEFEPPLALPPVPSRRRPLDPGALPEAVLRRRPFGIDAPPRREASISRGGGSSSTARFPWVEGFGPEHYDLGNIAPHRPLPAAYGRPTRKFGAFDFVQAADPSVSALALVAGDRRVHRSLHTAGQRLLLYGWSRACARATRGPRARGRPAACSRASSRSPTTAGSCRSCTCMRGSSTSPRSRRRRPGSRASITRALARAGERARRRVGRQAGRGALGPRIPGAGVAATRRPALASTGSPAGSSPRWRRRASRCSGCWSGSFSATASRRSSDFAAELPRGRDRGDGRAAGVGARALPSHSTSRRRSASPARAPGGARFAST